VDPISCRAAPITARSVPAVSGRLAGGSGTKSSAAGAGGAILGVSRGGAISACDPVNTRQFFMASCRAAQAAVEQFRTCQLAWLPGPGPVQAAHSCERSTGQFQVRYFIMNEVNSPAPVCLRSNLSQPGTRLGETCRPPQTPRRLCSRGLDEVILSGILLPAG
jgi:hypothetical protein